jgi:transposase-like protein/IS1 family transposase
MDFTREFPDDDACLEYLWRTRYAADGTRAHCRKCDQTRAFKRYATGQRRQSWTCTGCGLHVHPTAGTIFHKSSTSLQLWFYAMYLMTSTRCGIAAKQLERELGVNYKTAWRMFNKIRNELMADEDDTPLTGIVEVDETSIEGKPRYRQGRSEAALYRERSRATVFAAVERKGRVRATVLESRRGPALKEQVIEWVAPAAIVMTDEWPAYSGLDQHFADHSRVRHSTREYAFGSTNTNTVEGFFGNLKTGIRGNYKKVSRRWLQGYLNEFCWRYNRRHGVGQRAMFRELIARSASV